MSQPCPPCLLSINAAQAQNLEVGVRTARTGHFKQPLDGPVTVEQAGVPGDFIGDLKHHGGPDQAIYLYSQEDIDWWSEQLQRPLAAGFCRCRRFWNQTCTARGVRPMAAPRAARSLASGSLLYS